MKTKSNIATKHSFFGTLLRSWVSNYSSIWSLLGKINSLGLKSFETATKKWHFSYLKQNHLRKSDNSWICIFVHGIRPLCTIDYYFDKMKFSELMIFNMNEFKIQKIIKKSAFTNFLLISSHFCSPILVLRTQLKVS